MKIQEAGHISFGERYKLLCYSLIQDGNSCFSDNRKLSSTVHYGAFEAP